MRAAKYRTERSRDVNNDLATLLRSQTTFQVAELSAVDNAGRGVFPTYLQDGVDVHGSHPLFYWLRARGQGIYLWSDGAGVALTWRRDIQRFVALRPVGSLDGIVEILDGVAKLMSNKWPGFPLVTRYCGTAVSERLIERGWRQLAAPWLPGMPLDDETYPEVLVTAEPVEVPDGPRYRSVRNAIHRHETDYIHRTSPVTLNCGELQFIRSGAARADHYDDQERSYNSALLTALTFRDHTEITHHYLFDADEKLSAFAITTNTTGISHLHYMGTTKTSRLSVYFQWKIYLEERARGAEALNLGGSEIESLHQFKTHTFPDHVLRRTTILQHPGSV